MWGSLGRYDVVSHVGSEFLQMFLYEQFEALMPKHVGYSATVLSVNGGMGGLRGRRISTRLVRPGGQA